MSVSSAAADAADLLRAAHQRVADSRDHNDGLVQAALHLILCAVDIVDLLPDSDLDGARRALGSARAAVVTATYAVQRIDGDVRMRIKTR